jgi:hypothetical protein
MSRHENPTFQGGSAEISSFITIGNSGTSIEISAVGSPEEGGDFGSDCPLR